MNSSDNWYIGYGDGTSIHFRSDSTPSDSQIGQSLGTIGMHYDYSTMESPYSSGDGDSTFNVFDASAFFNDWNGNNAYFNMLDLRGYSVGQYMEEYGHTWSADNQTNMEMVQDMLLNLCAIYFHGCFDDRVCNQRYDAKR